MVLFSVDWQRGLRKGTWNGSFVWVNNTLSTTALYAPAAETKLDCLFFL